MTGCRCEAPGCAEPARWVRVRDCGEARLYVCDAHRHTAGSDTDEDCYAPIPLHAPSTVGKS